MRPIEDREVHALWGIAQFMLSPAVAARRWLLATGFGLLLVYAFSTQMAASGIEIGSYGLIFALLGTVFIALGFLAGQDSGALSNAFPNELADDASNRIRNRLEQAEKDGAVNDKWAKLEVAVIEETLNISLSSEEE